MLKTLLFAVMSMVLLAGTVSAVAWNYRLERDQRARIRSVVAAIEQMEREIRVRAATGQTEVNGRGWPDTIDPAWFKQDPPFNVLVPRDRPWLEIASFEDEGLDHPSIRQAVTKNLASFWYNPATGRVRARVGPMVSDRDALLDYNTINGSALDTLFDSDVETVAQGEATSNPRYERLLSGADTERPMIVVRKRVRATNTGSAQNQPKDPKKIDGAPAGDRRVTNADDSGTNRD